MIPLLLENLEALFSWLIAASWQASVLALFVLLIQRLFAAHLNPRWRYALWLLVLLRLLLPALPESALSLFQFAPPPPAALEVSVTEPLFSSPPPPLPAANVTVSPAPPASPITFYSLLALVWLSGAVVLLILTWLVNRRFAQQVARAPAISDPELLRLFAEARTELRIRRPIRLIESRQISSPAIMGLSSPTLLLPADVRQKFDPRELRFIFLHELAHLKRGDVIVQALIALLQILHWFNPVLWYAFRRMRIDREPATDALVLSRTGEAEKERYGLMLIKLLEHFNQRHSLPTLVGILEDKDQFKRRFGLIARFTRGAYGWSLLGVLLIALLAVACLTRSKGEDSPKTAAPKSETTTLPSNNPDLNAQLLAAVQKGDAAAAQKLIDQGIDPNKVEDQGQPLIFAAGSPAVVEILLQHGANLNARNRQKDAVLCCLLRNKGAQAAAIARVLLEHGADPNIRSGELGETPLMDARDGTAVDLLIQHGGDIHLKMTDGSGVLDMASDHPLDYFQALLRHGVPLDVKKDGPTLLLRASWISNLPIMKEMIDRGVDPNVEGVWAMVNGKPDLMLPIRAATVGNQPEAAKFLLAHGAKADDDMITALFNRNNKIVKLFWESGVRNISELCYQISQGAPISDLGKLLDAGVPAAPPQDKKITPLGEAAQLGNMEAVKLLIAHKADVNANGQPDPKSPKGWEMTPLCLAAAEGQDEVVAYLLQHGATPDPAAVYQAGFNSYPYSNQRSKDHFEKTVRILIDAGALKNITPDMAGLVLAGPLGTRQGPPNSTVLKMVLDAGVSPESPMPYLAENGEKPNTVIGYYREYYQKRKDDPTYASFAANIKPLLDLLEAADKTAPKSETTTAPAAAPSLDTLRDLDTLKKDLLAAQEDADARHVLLAVNDLPDDKFVATLNGLGRADPAITALQADLIQKQNDITKLLTNGYAENTPQVQTARAILDARQQQMKSLIDGRRRAMTIDAQMGDARVTALRQQLAAASTSPSSPPTPDLSQQLKAAQEDTSVRHVLFDKVHNLPDDQFLATLSALGRTDASVSSLQQEIDGKNADITGLLKSGFSPDHPRVVNLREEIAYLQDALVKATSGIRRAMAIDLQMADSRVALLQNQLGASGVNTASPAGTASQPAPPQVRLELKVSEIDDDVYLAHKDEIDTALKKGGVGIITLLNNLKGVSLLSAPSVTTQPGLKATVDIVREFPYPISFNPAKSFQNLPISSNSGPVTNLTAYAPPTPSEFVTKDVGISADLMPTVHDDKIDLSCSLRITDFDGFIETNQALQTPAFDIREANFLEEFGHDDEIKGALIPGLHSEEETVTDHDSAGKVLSEKKVAANKRLLVFLSARLVQPDGSSFPAAH
jgi:bla regulator protein blaR1